MLRLIAVVALGLAATAQDFGLPVLVRTGAAPIPVRADGKCLLIVKGEFKVNENHACYGAEVLAVADATVVKLTDGLPDNTPGEKSQTASHTGNSVVLDLGKDRYALYAHLQRGVRVKQGDRVRAG